MLGSSSLQSHAAKSYSLDIKPRVFAEWNNNLVSPPYACGTDTRPISFSEVTSLTPVGSSPEEQIVNRGFSTPIDNSTNCLLLVSNDDEQAIKVSSRQISSGVVTLTIKDGVNTIGVGKDIFVESPDNDINGRFVTASGTNRTKIVYDTGNGSLNKNKSTIRNSSVYLSESAYYVDSASTNGAVKFSMALKSDYEYQSDPEYVDKFDVILTVYGIKSGKRVWSQVASKKVSVDSRSWDYVDIMYANPDEDFNSIDSFRLFIEISVGAGQKAALLVDKLMAFDISPYEVYVSDIMPIKNIFSANRPGELLVDNPGINVSLRDGTAFPQQPTGVHMAMRWGILRKFNQVQRSVAPYPGNPNNYYVSGSSLASKRFWALYDKSVKTNKIIIKVNSIINKPDNFELFLLVGSTWTSTIITTEEFNDNGILALYYDGSSWSDQKWAYNAHPKISTQSGSIDKSVEINGIAIAVSTLQYSSGNSEIRRSSSYDLNYLDIIEISPRLELDLTDYLIDFKLQKEMYSGELPLPLGSISSNTASIRLNKYPVIVNSSDNFSSETDDVIPISNYASTFSGLVESKNSPLKDMLIRGVKIKGFFDIDQSVSGVGATISKDYVPAFTMYAERWQEDDESVSVECYDSIKKLQLTPARPIYLEGKGVKAVVMSILDSSGFSDYYFDELNDLRVIDQNEETDYSLANTISHYWSNRNSSVTDTLNDIFKPYQIGMYCDEYGGVRFTSLYELAKRRQNIESEDILYVQDFSDANSVSNIEGIDFVDIEKPSKININYKKPYPWNNVPELRGKVRRDLLESGQSATSTSTTIVWEPEEDALMLPYFELAAPGITSKTQKFIKYDVSRTQSINRSIDFSGYLLIDKEIVSYDGLEYKFTPASISGKKIVPDEANSFTAIIKSPSDIESVRSDAFERFNKNNVVYGPTGNIMNVVRGEFGTEPEKHPVMGDREKKNWSIKQFSSSYGNITDINPASSSIISMGSGYMSLNSNLSSGGYFIYPDENNTVGKKRKLFARYSLGDIPKNRSGYLGVGIGVDISGGKIQNGLFIYTGIKSKDKKKNVKLFSQQVVNGVVQNIVKKSELDLDETLFDEDENIELYIKFNKKMTEMRVFVGPTSVFQKVKKIKKDGEKTEKIINVAQEINSVKRTGFFGFVVLESGVGALDDLAFMSSGDPRDLATADFYEIEDDYSGDKNAGVGFYIGANTLLDQIVYNRFVDMSIDNSLNKNNFIWTGAPVARGLKVVDAEYQEFPVTGKISAEFLGYSYPAAAARTNSVFNEGDENG